MFLDASGETVFYMRRVEGRDTLFMFRPDLHGGDHHAILSQSLDAINAWQCPGRCVVLCDRWPAGAPHLKFKFFDMARIGHLLERQAVKIHELLTDVPMLTTLSPEHRPLPPEIYDMIKGEVVVAPGKAPFDDAVVRPALFVFDGKDATARAEPLSFLRPTDLPSRVYRDPSGARLWLTMGDSCHLFVLDASTYELAGDIIWPVDEQALARLAFHPIRPEAWVATLSSVRVYDRGSLKLLREISIAPELRWHRGDRVKGLVGALAFSADGKRALVARPLHGDVLELDTASFATVKSHATFVDPLELVVASRGNRVYLQGMRAGQVSWMPWT
ncbi:MAG: hypothetical protein IT462_17975 [Planctomycetes bacterium]|nr:hypothetical protein [Planctomycetota bacterium]